MEPWRDVRGPRSRENLGGNPMLKSLLPRVRRRCRPQLFAAVRLDKSTCPSQDAEHVRRKRRGRRLVAAPIVVMLRPRSHGRRDGPTRADVPRPTDVSPLDAAYKQARAIAALGQSRSASLANQIESTKLGIFDQSSTWPTVASKIMSNTSASSSSERHAEKIAGSLLRSAAATICADHDGDKESIRGRRSQRRPRSCQLTKTLVSLGTCRRFQRCRRIRLKAWLSRRVVGITLPEIAILARPIYDKKRPTASLYVDSFS